jgi:1,5-anhydro-D-fructose reductase (1,5-anhydro-D-mannitol-forming)
VSFGWGIAGCGWIARDAVAPAVQASRLGELVALTSLDAGEIAAVAPGAEVHRTTDLDAFLATPGLDGVYVATPNHAHAEVVEAAAAAGKHVLCEKPMATTLADARRMVDACERAGVLYHTAFNQRWHPAHVRLRELVADGAIGTVTQARIRYACETPPWWGADDWHFDPGRAGGGALFDLAPHGLDLVGVLIDRPLVEVTGLRQRALLAHGVEDGAAVVARYEGDVLATIQVAYTTPETLPRRELELIGTEGMAITRDTMGQDAGGRLTLIPAGDGMPRPVSYVPQDGDPFRLEVDAFAEAATGGVQWAWPPWWDLRVMAALEAAMATSGVEVT